MYLWTCVLLTEACGLVEITGWPVIVAVAACAFVVVLAVIVVVLGHSSGPGGQVKYHLQLFWSLPHV